MRLSTKHLTSRFRRSIILIISCNKEELMICNKCGTENPEGAVYCKECGKRLDGLVACPNCGNMNPEDAVYCVSCGTRIDGMTVCSCGEVYSGNFCPRCGTKNAAAPKKYGAERTGDAPLWQKALKLGGGIAAMTMVFFSLLFVFFIGFIVNTHGTVSGASFGIDLGNSAPSIFDFFGKNFEEIKDTLDMMDGYEAVFHTALYLTATLEIIVAVGVLVAVPVLAAISGVFFVRNVCGKSERNYARLSIATFFTYLLGAALLLVLEQIKFSIKATGSSTLGSSGAVSIWLGFNKATLTGLIMGAILLAVFAGCHIAANGSKLLKKSRGVPMLFAFGGSVLAIVALCLAASAALKFDFKSVSTTVVRGNLTLSFMSALQLIIGAYDYGFELKSPDSLLALGAIAQFVQFGLLICLALLIIFRLQDVVSGKNASELVLSILVFVFAVAHLVLTIVFGDKFIELTESENLELVLTSVIAILVVSALNLALSAVHLSVKKFLSENPEEN